MVRLIHISDTHEDSAAKLRAVGSFAKSVSASAILHTGDITSRKAATEKAAQSLQSIPEMDRGLLEKLQKDTLTEEEKQKVQKRMILEQQAIIGPYAKEYQEFEREAAEIKKSGIELILASGNWDLEKLMHKTIISAKHINFEDIVFKGLRIKHIYNNWEEPKPYSKFGEALRPYMIPFELGHDESNAEELKKVHADYYKHLKKGEKPDLIMMHKGLEDPIKGEKGLGTAAKKYLADNKYVPVFCGHFHGDEINNYKDHPFIRAGQNSFYVVDVDEQTKRINWIDIYMIVRKGSADGQKHTEAESEPGLSSMLESELAYA